MTGNVYRRGISDRTRNAIIIGALVLFSLCSGFVISRKGWYDNSNTRPNYPTPPPTVASYDYSY